MTVLFLQKKRKKEIMAKNNFYVKTVNGSWPFFNNYHSLLLLSETMSGFNIKEASLSLHILCYTFFALSRE